VLDDLNRVAVIVLNWNRRDDTLRCLDSLAAVTEPAIDVFMVDNGSSDNSEEAVREAFPLVRVVQNGANFGFAEGNNAAIRLALAEGYRWIMLLNNDTTLAEDAIAELLQPLVDDETIGISSGAIVYMATPETVWSAGGRIDRPTGRVLTDWLDQPLAALPGETYSVDHVSGCAMLLRSAAIRKAGLLDPRFFMYYEETEWCARIAACGYRIVVNPRAVIHHSIDPAAQAGSPSIAYYMTRNHLLFLRATGAPVRAWAYTLYWQGRTLASLFVRPSSPTRARGRVPMLRAIRDFLLGRFGQLENAR
jgi:GT2 family glycosyltransferase